MISEILVILINISLYMLFKQLNQRVVMYSLYDKLLWSIISSVMHVVLN